MNTKKKRPASLKLSTKGDFPALRVISEERDSGEVIFRLTSQKGFEDYLYVDQSTAREFAEQIIKICDFNQALEDRKIKEAKKEQKNKGNV